MTVFDDLHSGSFYNIKNKNYQIEVHGEIDRCDDLCHRINLTAPREKADIAMMEYELFHTKNNGSYITPPLYIDCGNQVKLGNNVYINHNITMMSLGKITIDDNVMIGPGVGLFTVNHKAKDIQMIMTNSIHIKRGAWIGARVNILPGVTIGENSIIGTGSVVTKDIPDNSVAVGNPAKVIKRI